MIKYYKPMVYDRDGGIVTKSESDARIGKESFNYTDSLKIE